MNNLAFYACVFTLGFAIGHSLALWCWVPSFGRKKLQRSEPDER